VVIYTYEPEPRGFFRARHTNKMGTDEAAKVGGLGRRTHIRYGLRHVRMLPPAYQTDDSNRITFGFFALGSLAILGGQDRLDLSEKADYIHWIYRRWNPVLGGFGGAPSIDLRGLAPDQDPYDPPHLTHTYTALLILGLLTLPSSETPEPESPYGSLDLPKLLRFVGKCQRPNGSFGSFPDSLDEDVRFVYCAVAILAIVRVDPASVIDVDAAERFLKSCRRYEGGYGQAPYAEAQGGTTYCALASLALLGRLESGQTEEEASQTVRWLVDRQGEVADSSESSSASSDDGQEEEGTAAGADSQPEAHGPVPSCPAIIDPTPHGDLLPATRQSVAGFQGRIGKPLDACYSFWCTAALTIMSDLVARKPPLTTPPNSHSRTPKGHESPTPLLYDADANVAFLLRCQSDQWGGIARSPGDHPDVYHTYLALASLSLSAHAAAASSSEQGRHGGPSNDLVDALAPHDPLLNVPVKVSQWISKCFSPTEIA